VARRTEFYALKDRLLQRYASYDGVDVQHIVKPCWGPGCDGDENRFTCPGSSCRKCGGTGVFSERFIPLQRWNFEGRIFHRPMGETSKRPATIEGHILHGDVDAHAAADAALWLFLLCDRRLFWSTLGASSFVGVRP
jgi:hypothetical protein